MFRCDRRCEHWVGIKICSHTVATAESNGKLNEFLEFYRTQNIKINLSSVSCTDMPQNPGKKSGTAGSRKRKSRPPVEERVQRYYGEPLPNVNPFFIKPMNNLIRLCHGCRGSLRDNKDEIPSPPYDFCIARKERNPFKHNSGKMMIPGKETDSHYHLKISCIKKSESNFKPSFLQIDETLPGLTREHIDIIRSEFK